MKITYSNNQFGDITLANGVTISLTQQAYLSGTNDAPRYEARAVDADGNEYTVTWTPYENFMELEDESDCCDWDDYEVTMR